MTRAEGERERLTHALRHLRAVADSVELALQLKAPMGADLAQSVETVANNISRGIAKHDAFLLAEQDARRGSDGEEETED